MEEKPKKNLDDKKFLCPEFKALQRLGKGTYGTVYKAQKSKSSEFVAIKKIKLDVESEGVPSTTLREISILKKCSHQNVVR